MADLLLELRFEEMPVSYIRPAAQALEKGLQSLLEGVPGGESRVFSTPRRIGVAVTGLELGRPPVEALKLGPSVDIAKVDGVWTRAAEGFARGKGLTTEDLQVVDGPKGLVIAAQVKTGGESVQALVIAGLESLVLGLSFPKSMRWGSASLRWARPLHAVCAVFDGECIATTVGGLETTNTVQGHRRSPLPPAVVTGLDDYLSGLRERWVEPDRAQRLAHMRAELHSRAEALGVSLGGDEALFEEVVDLVEWPMVVAGHFDADLLHLPPRLLEESMRVHQRTFPTMEGDKLSHHVLIVSNNPQGDEATISEGNARVLAARFHDARFFFAEDQKRTLASFEPALERMRWVRGLGNMAEKQQRLAALTEGLSAVLGGDRANAERAARLCKLDLVSQMVQEFPKLQGHMGRLYAEKGGESTSVSLAIEEHYLPDHAGGRLASTPEGRTVALADRLDSLAGCFGTGLVPKGSADPQGLRRAANGVLAILLDNAKGVSLGELYGLALDGHGEALTRPRDEVLAHLLEFTLSRARATLQAQGFRTDLVDAVLAAGGDDPIQVQSRVQALDRLSKSGEFADLMTAFKRVLNITKDHTDPSYDQASFQEPVEHALREGVEGARDRVKSHLDSLDVDGALAAMTGLKPQIDAYFDEVLVMAPEPEIRKARLGLLVSASHLFLTVADFRRISTEADRS